MMQRLISAVIVSSVIAVTGYTKTIITAEDYAVDGDVVLESMVDEVKAVPRDTVYVVDDVTEFLKDETGTAASGIKSVFKNGQTAHEKAQLDGASTVKDAWDASTGIEFRSYKISERLGDLLMAYSLDNSAVSVDVTEFFKGIDFPKGSAARYLPEFQSLFVHQIPNNLLIIEDVLSTYRRAQKDLMGRQVEIEIKFIEVSESTLDELGFDWTFESKGDNGLRIFDDVYLPGGQELFSSGLRGAASALGGGPDAGVLEFAKTAGSLQWSLVISALEQSGDSDVLSAPRVVAHSHETALIQVGEERMIPKAFEVVNQNTSPFVQHSDWELELMGVHMEVTPEIRRDGLIDLELNSKIFDIIGYDSYQITPEYRAVLGATSISPGSAAYQITEVTASLPYLRVRALDTRLTVADGNTIAMGGLIYDKLETFRDKVPVLGSIPWLGRLFRSEGQRSVKRNLMIFVTATQVDVNGRRAADIALEK